MGFWESVPLQFDWIALKVAPVEPIPLVFRGREARPSPLPDPTKYRSAFDHLAYSTNHEAGSIVVHHMTTAFRDD